MSKINADELFGMDSDPITKEMMLDALQLVENIIESAGGAEACAAFELLLIDKDHLTGLKNRISTNETNKRMKLTLGDHLLIYTSYYLFTKLYSDELTSQMLISMDDMDRMHLDEPEILHLRFYCEEMQRAMSMSKDRFSSLPRFTKHLETLDITFPLITG